MRILNRIRQYRIYRRLVISYLLTIVLSITVVSAILYTLFSAKAVTEIDNSSKQMLSQVSYTANVVYKQIQDVMNQLLVDDDINAFLYARDDNKITDYKAYLIISKVQSIYPFISNISLYNFSNGQYIDAIGLPRDEKVADPAKKQFINFYPRTARKDENNQYQLLTFRIVPEWQTSTNIPKSALVIDLKLSYIQNTIRGINESIKNGDTFVMDDTGKMLSNSDSQNFMKDFSNKDYISRILRSSQNQGSFTQMINDQKNLITYVKSSTLNWYFVTVRPYNQLLTNVYALRNWTFLVALLLVLLGTAISFFLSGNMYNPIRVLVDRVMERQKKEPGKEALLNKDEYALLSNVFISTIEFAENLESTLKRSKQALKSSLIISILKGIDRATMTNIELEWGDQLKGPFFKVIIFKVDELRAFRGTYSPFDRELIRYAVGNIAQELLEKDYRSDFAVTEDEIVVIVQFDQKDNNDTLYLTLSEIQDTVQSYYTITVTASIGDWSSSLDRLKNSYRSAQEYMLHRLFYGHNSIVDGERKAKDRDASLRYPSSKEQKLIDAVKLCNEQHIQREIQDWIHFLSNCTYTQAIQFTSFLFLAVIREFEHITEWLEVEPDNLYSYFHQISHVETLTETQLQLTDLCSRIVAVIEENKQNVSMQKNTRLIEEVK
ncbi:MAG: hypothetical protein A2189_02545, partial [Paenibacillus sp. RIFOXYA1_FULL_44_5]